MHTIENVFLSSKTYYQLKIPLASSNRKRGKKKKKKKERGCGRQGWDRNYTEYLMHL